MPRKKNIVPEDENAATFSKNLRYLVDSRGYDGVEFSIRIGFTQATVSRYLSGERVPDIKYCIEIAKFFGVSLDWLFGLTDERKRNESPEELALWNAYNRASKSEKETIDFILRDYMEK